MQQKISGILFKGLLRRRYCKTMAKIFISFLGTNDYLECSYKYQNTIVKNVRFVQEATIKLNCTNWSTDDRVIIFTTDDSFSKNWKDNGHRDSGTGRTKDRVGLEQRIRSMDLGCQWYNVQIKDGKTESEIWHIFSTVFEQINQNDEIIFDITHAFRSIPMLATIILNYARIIKDISLQGWFYGAMEAVGSLKDVKKMPVEKRIIPIFDLTSFDRLTEWSNGIDQFLTSGNASKVSQLALKSTVRILSETKGKDRSQNKIKGFAKALDKFTKTLSTCRGLDISDDVIRLKQNIEDCRKIELSSPLNKPLQPLFEKVEIQLAKFEKSSVKDGIQAAKWCLDHNLIQQGYTILQETLITYFVSMIGEDPENFENRNRNRTIANQAVTIFLEKKSEKTWFKESACNKDMTKRFLNIYKKNKNLVKRYRDLTGSRNDINHCGFNDHPAKVKTLEKNLEKFISNIERNI